MKRILIGIILSMATTHVLAATAPAAWGNPTVATEIAAKVLYVPICDAAVTKIPITATAEDLIDLLEINNPRIKPLATFDKKFQNTYQGYSKVRLGVYNNLLTMLQLLPDNIGIAYFEGFRTLAKQKQYFDEKFAEILAIIPDKEQAYTETTKHVSPFIDNVPTHATGAAIDMTLFMINDGKETLLDMGKFDVIFGPNEQQETFSANTTAIQRKNRLQLLTAATQAGFANYGFEWWHYSYGDKMHAAVYNQKNAIYGLADNSETAILAITKEDYLSSFDN